VVAPTVTFNVPVTATGLLTASGTSVNPPFISVATSTAQIGGITNQTCTEQVSGCSDNSGNLRFNDAFTVTSNVAYAVVLNASTHGTATATADPYIQIDSAFLAANPGYSLEFSQGINNVPVGVTPLPAALPLFGSAVVGLFGFAHRRKSRINQATA
jgi:hypothetical protein